MNRREKELVKIQIEKEKEKFATIVANIYKLATVSVLHRTFGFGKKRLTKFIDEIAKECDVVASGMIGFEDYKTSVEEETGFKLEEE